MRYLIVCLCTMLMLSCRDDRLYTSDHVVEGVPVNVSLNFASTPETDIVVTRANNDLLDLSSLAIFIYTGDTFEQLVRISDGSLTIGEGTEGNDGVLYSAQFQTTSGTKNLLAVANGSTEVMARGFWESLQPIAQAATNGKYTFDELKSAVINLRESLYANNNEMQPIQIVGSDQMLMSGWNEGVVIDAEGKVMRYGNNAGGKNVIFRLDRAMARITFNIPEKIEDAKGIFTPTSYKVYNIPVKSYLTNSDGKTAGSSFGFKNFVQANVPSVNEGKYSFSFYMPENRYAVVTADAKGNPITDYHDRDKWTGDPGDLPNKKEWIFAPQNSTFVVISGTYEESGTHSYTGNVDYTIHLGDFSNTTGNMGNFSVERNCSYTYTLKVLDVDRIVVEAKKEGGTSYQEGSEGFIYDYGQSNYSYQLDAHYEQVFLEYNLSKIAKNLSNDVSLDDAIANALILVIQSEAMDYSHPTEMPDEPYVVRNKRGVLRPYKIYADAGNYSEATTAKNKVLKGQGSGTAPTAGFDYKWIEFWPQSGTDLAAYPGVSDWSKEDLTGFANSDAYGGTATGETERLMDVYDVIVEMGKAVKQIKENETPDAPTSEESHRNGQIILTQVNGDYVARFTAFVNEYYYYRHPLTGEKITSWSVFTNKMPREMIIAMSTDVSTDGNSSYSTLHSYISQLSMETFYSSRNSSALTGFGIETYNETPLSTFISDYSNFNSYREDNLNLSDKEGRANQLALLDMSNANTPDWNYYIQSASNGWKASVTSDRTTHELKDAYTREGAYAYAACLSRNRDLNGNGKIDPEEVRWYLPSLNEYIRISIGSGAISNAAQLYYGDKNNLQKGQNNEPTPYPLDYIKDGALYYTSSGRYARVYWAIERGSYSGVGNKWGGEEDFGKIVPKPIRCIRLLPGNDNNIDISSIEGIESVPTYEWDDTERTLTFSGKLVEPLYRESTERLSAHNEDEAANGFYTKIKVAEKNADSDISTDAIDNFPLGQIIRATGYSTTNPCETYHEEGDGGARWRVPNLVELSAMHAAGCADANTACCTQFSNLNVRFGYYIATAYDEDRKVQYNYISCPGNNDTLNKTYIVRCVRDVTNGQ